jgi:hypothetical protein
MISSLLVSGILVVVMLLLRLWHVPQGSLLRPPAAVTECLSYRRRDLRVTTEHGDIAAKEVGSHGVSVMATLAVVWVLRA